MRKTLNSNLNDLISGLLKKDPKERLTWEQYFNHSFFMRNKQDFRNYYKLESQIPETNIYKVKSIENNKIKAIKIFDINKIKNNFRKNNLRIIGNDEINVYINDIYKLIQNMIFIEGKYKEKNNIVKFYEYFHFKDEIAIVMELCDDNLLNLFVNKKQNLSSKEIYEILSQLNNFFRIMTKNKLIYRTLNIKKILIKYENKEKTKYKVKIKLSEDNCFVKDLANNPIKKESQNINFIAPEILKKEDYNEKCDLWSIGVIIYILSFRKYPYIGNRKKEILNEIKSKGKLPINSGDSNLNDLIKGLLKEEPNKRFTWEQYFNHPFFNNY